MGNSRTLNKQPKTRPKKKPRERRRREALQKKRLEAQGVPAEVLRTMNAPEVRDLLQHPKKLKAFLARLGS